jgi:DnaK suppressor protein
MSTPKQTQANDAGLDAEQQATLKQLLLDARTALTARRANQLQTQSSLRSEVEDDGDAALRADQEDTLLTLAESGHARLAEIDRALAKFDSGEYGLDEDSDEPIGFDRLRVIPWARFAASTQEAREG